MATITILRGLKSYTVWNYLRDNGIEFMSYRLYSTEPGVDLGLLAFDIADERVAVELALRYG